MSSDEKLNELISQLTPGNKAVAQKFITFLLSDQEMKNLRQGILKNDSSSNLLYISDRIGSIDRKVARLTRIKNSD